MENLTQTQKRIYEAAIHLFATKGSTELTVSELAQQAGITRATVYNNIPTLDNLFETVATSLAAEMTSFIVSTFEPDDSPEVRMAKGIRMFVHRGYSDTDWARFLIRFGVSTSSFEALWASAPLQDLQAGIEAGIFKMEAEQLPVAIGLLGASVTSALHLVLVGHKTWRDAGSDAAEFILRAFGVPAKKARKISRQNLPELDHSLA